MIADDVVASVSQCVDVDVEFCSSQDASDDVSKCTGWSKSVVQ